MWTRIQLKERAKETLKINYWKIVLVSLIVGLIGGGATAQVNNTFETESDSSFESEDMDILNDLFSEAGAGYENDQDITGDLDLYENEYDYSQWYENPNASDEYWEGYYDGYFGNAKADDAEDYLAGYNDGEIDDYVENDFGEAFEDGFSSGELGGISAAQIAGLGIIIIVLVVVIVVIASVVGLVYSAFILNPVDVGTKRFFFKTLNEKAEVKEVAFVFDNNYQNVAKTLFIRDLKVLLWCLLFIIPGIVKSYEYYMMPYLLAENPNLTREEAFRLSKQMMTGQKWNTFVLELSFFWWDVLSAMTVGIVGIFYVNPYKNLTFAALYEELSAINGYPARAAAAQPNMANPYMQADYQTPEYEQQEPVEYSYIKTPDTTDNTYNSPE